MNSTGIDLLVRVVAKQLDVRSCARCSEPLRKARISLGGIKDDQLIVEAVCGACGHTLHLAVRPEIDGVARIT